MPGEKIKILFITQKIHQDDDDLAFVILWIKEFIRQGAEVQVICLQEGEHDNSFPVYSLGKENGCGKLKKTINFFRLIFKLDYNRVFVHMNPEYITLGGWYWFVKKIPIYLWYTHYKMHIHLWLSGIFCRRMFAATSQSLPQYNDNLKKVVTGHGIDVDYWFNNNSNIGVERDEFKLIAVHRLCRSKRLELGIRALKFLPDNFTLHVYGRDVEKDYVEELKELIKKENLGSRVMLAGPVPMGELKKIYPQYSLMINMASETIDKTMLEGMLFGLFPVTTPGNSKAIGLTVWPKSESPEELARFILAGEWKKFDKSYLVNVVKVNHSLTKLVEKMFNYIKIGD
jgi:glycosyltransferase involved in cell wall biosynthesis